MTFSGRHVVPILVAAKIIGVAAQANWLTPPMEQGLTQQLAGRLASIEPRPPADKGAVSESARQAVRAIGAHLGSWTDAVVIARAPAFPQLTMPTAKEPLLNAMAAYQMCTATQFMRFELDKDSENRRATVLGLTAMTMAVLRLRRPFLASGGSDEGIEAFLTSEPLGAVLEAVQATPALLAHVEGQCRPVVEELVGKTGTPAP